MTTPLFRAVVAGEPVSRAPDAQTLIAELTRARAVFQARTIAMVIGGQVVVAGLHNSAPSQDWGHEHAA